MRKTARAAVGNGVSVSPSRILREKEKNVHDLESLQEENLKLKTQLHQLQKECHVQKTKIVRLENEIKKGEKHIDLLLQNQYAVVSSPEAEKIRMNQERNKMVKGFHQEINDLKLLLAERDKKLKDLSSSQKATALMHLTAERDEYLAEVVRLREVVQGLQERVEWGVNANDEDNEMKITRREQQQNYHQLLQRQDALVDNRE